MSSTVTLSRRGFLKAAAIASPFFIGGCANFSTASYPPGRRPAASDRINLAVIGCGGMGGANLNQFLQDPRVQVTLVCDPIFGPTADHPYPRNGRDVFRQRVDKFYKTTGCRMTADWREVAADPTVDAVLIATPDYWHALMAIGCMKAGKHVYCQKPLSLGINEGREMVRVSKMCNVVFQVGNQGRADSVKRIAAEIVRNKLIGDLKSVTVAIPSAKVGSWWWGDATRLGRVKAPSCFTKESWDLWLGPTQHWPDDAFIPAIHSPLIWRICNRTGNGLIPDFGAHEIDTVQWALDTERTGPVAIENFKADTFNTPRECFSWAMNFEFDVVYASGMRVKVLSTREGYPRGVWFHGEKGTVNDALYSGLPVKLGLPDHLKKWREKKDLKDGDIRLYAPKDGHSHEMDFIDGIYENRPIATDCEIGHRSTSISLLANICERLGRTGLKWDPVAERVIGDDEANALLDVPHLNGWELKG